MNIMIFYRHIFCESSKLFFRSPRFWSERSTVSAKQSIIMFAFEWCIEFAVVYWSSRKRMREGFWSFNGAVSGVSITSLCSSGFYCIVVACSGRLWTWRPYLALCCFVPLQHPPGSIAHRIGCLERSRLWLSVCFVVSVLWCLCCVLQDLVKHGLNTFLAATHAILQIFKTHPLRSCLLPKRSGPLSDAVSFACFAQSHLES